MAIDARDELRDQAAKTFLASYDRMVIKKQWLM
jgi:hypothetical protein